MSEKVKKWSKIAKLWKKAAVKLLIKDRNVPIQSTKCGLKAFRKCKKRSPIHIKFNGETYFEHKICFDGFG